MSMQRTRTYPQARSIERALCDLGDVPTLRRLGEHGPLQAAVGEGSIYAGALFGRDSLLMALDLLEDFPRVAERTLMKLAELQGTRVTQRSEEEPGRILHEHRFTAARRDKHWKYPYYGTVDANCLFARLVERYVAHCGPEILSKEVRRRDRTVSVAQALMAAVAWVESRLDRTGFVHVLRANPNGLANQVWPDSYDAFYFEDGSLFDPAIAYAPIAVQGYAYDALLTGAKFTVEPAVARRWKRRAEQLRRDVLRTFWQPHERMFAVAVELPPNRKPRQSRVVASDAGHLLTTGLLVGEDTRQHRESVRDRLLASDMLGGAGVRTKSVGAPRFNPGSYHNGSVWPMDTGIIAEGLRQHGYAEEAEDLEDRILRAVACAGSPVEFFRGDTDGEIRINTQRYVLPILGTERTVEQPPQAVQGWTVTRVWRIMRRRGLV
jgi:glycogen debranching enzyme